MPVGEMLIPFSKKATGKTQEGGQRTPTCPSPKTEEITGIQLELDLSAGPCDDGSAVAEQLNGHFSARVTVIWLLEGDPFQRGCFEGEWRFQGQQGATGGGQIHGTVGAGTHHGHGTNPCEDCRSPEHYEGLITGTVSIPKYFDARVCVSLVGQGPLVPGLNQTVAFEGVVIGPCRQ